MSGSTATANGTGENKPAGEATATRTRRKPQGPRKPSQARPVFIVMQVLNEEGQPMSMDKRRVKLLGIERDSNTVLELIDGGTQENAFYIRAMLQPTR